MGDVEICRVCQGSGESLVQPESDGPVEARECDLCRGRGWTRPGRSGPLRQVLTAEGRASIQRAIDESVVRIESENQKKQGVQNDRESRSPERPVVPIRKSEA